MISSTTEIFPISDEKESRSIIPLCKKPKPEHAKNAIPGEFDIWFGIIVFLEDCHFSFVAPLLMIVIEIAF